MILRSRAFPRRARALCACAVLCSVLAGCMGGGRRDLDRQVEYAELHPNIPKQIRQAVLGKKLIPGMPKDAIIASWGEPDEVLNLGGGDARWTYVRPQTVSGRRMLIEYALVLRRGVLHAIHHHTKR